MSGSPGRKAAIARIIGTRPETNGFGNGWMVGLGSSSGKQVFQGLPAIRYLPLLSGRTVMLVDVADCEFGVWIWSDSQLVLVALIHICLGFWHIPDAPALPAYLTPFSVLLWHFFEFKCGVLQTLTTCPLLSSELWACDKKCTILPYRLTACWA